MVLFNTSGRCKQCDTYFSSLGKHWRMSPDCGFPNDDEYIKRLIMGETAENVQKQVTVENTTQSELQAFS